MGPIVTFSLCMLCILIISPHPYLLLFPFINRFPSTFSSFFVTQWVLLESFTGAWARVCSHKHGHLNSEFIQENVLLQQPSLHTLLKGRLGSLEYFSLRDGMLAGPVLCRQWHLLWADGRVQERRGPDACANHSLPLPSAFRFFALACCLSLQGGAVDEPPFSSLTRCDFPRLFRPLQEVSE